MGRRRSDGSRDSADRDSETGSHPDGVGSVRDPPVMGSSTTRATERGTRPEEVGGVRDPPVMGSSTTRASEHDTRPEEIGGVTDPPVVTSSTTRATERSTRPEEVGGVRGPPVVNRSSDPNTVILWSRERAEAYYDREIESATQHNRLEQLERIHGREFHQWIEEGVPTAAMGDRQNITAYRYWKGTPVPWDIAQRNRDSLWRNTNDVLQKFRRGPAGQTGVPEEVRDVISSPGQSLDSSIQETVEERLGDSLGDVRIHTGPKAAEAAEAINARAFTVGNHIAFNHGEYDSESAEGQHVLAHELAHVRQQTGGAVSMLPQRELALEIDPDPELEREAEETAERVMRGGELGIERLQNTDVHVQRLPAEDLFPAFALFNIENSEEDPGEFQRSQNKSRDIWIRDHVLEDVGLALDTEKDEDTIEEMEQDIEHFERIAELPTEKLGGDEETISDVEEEAEVRERLRKRAVTLREELAEMPDASEIEQEKQRAEQEAADKLSQVGLTEEQRSRLGKDGVDIGLAPNVMISVAGALIGAVTNGLGGLGFSITMNVLEHSWDQLEGSIDERVVQAVEETKEKHLGETADKWEDVSSDIDQMQSTADASGLASSGEE